MLRGFQHCFSPAFIFPASAFWGVAWCGHSLKATLASGCGYDQIVYHWDDQRFNSCMEKKEWVELLKGYWWLIVVFGLLALQAARKYMAGKARLGLAHYLDYIDSAAELFGEGRVRSLLLVGLEPMDDTLRGVEELAKRGCDPTLSPFRPDPSTPLQNLAPPTVDVLMETYLRSQEIVSRYPGVQLGPRCVPCQHNTLTFPN